MSIHSAAQKCTSSTITSRPCSCADCLRNAAEERLIYFHARAEKNIIAHQQQRNFCAVCCQTIAEGFGVVRIAGSKYQCDHGMHKECAEWEAFTCGANNDAACRICAMKNNYYHRKNENGKLQSTGAGDNDKKKGIKQALKSIGKHAANARPMYFDLPIYLLPKQKKRKKKSGAAGDCDAVAGQQLSSNNNRNEMNVQLNNVSIVDERSGNSKCARTNECDDEICSRFQVYDRKMRKSTTLASEIKAGWKEDKHQMRFMAGTSAQSCRDMSTNRGSHQRALGKSSRAQRANQRRMMKSLNQLPTAFNVNLLSYREPSLRFAKSAIHAWGVFADEDIRAGDMICEYRGELIGNAVADRRELEYERQQIGSDYMFRIDARTVCDATKHGSVARFLNASCNPNCYTQIIQCSGSKRIVIYAKRDICRGEELYYDYKFPLEYIEKKRIPCHCGGSDCRGFMNWDKRYIAVKSS